MCDKQMLRDVVDVTTLDPMTPEELRGLAIYYADTLREIRDELVTIRKGLVEIRKELRKVNDAGK